ncbi:MAG: glycosyltransferase family 2 protein [Myxococcaceae bacterium]
MRVLDLLLVIWSVPVLVGTGYLFVLTVLSRRGEPNDDAAAQQPRLRFDIVVPAHNEEAGIARTVASLSCVDYPRGQRRILVVADNCTDSTAEKAREAGATVLVRNNEEKRGKGYALAHAFERSLREKQADAVVVIDADTLVSDNLLRAFAQRLEAGAQAVQADYAVANRDASWRTRLMSIALGMFHILRSLGRERMHVSCGLRGNGMCFTHGLLERIPHDAFSIVEDLEYGIRLGRAGVRVVYAEEAHVYGEMVSGEKASRSQRKRWEGGRLQIMKLHGVPLLTSALKQRSRLLFDIAMDVLIPPLSWLTAAAVVGSVLSFGLRLPMAAASFGTSLGFLTLYVFRGWWLSGSGWRGLFDLAFAPLYILWKLTLLFRGGTKRKDEWVRTAREGETR